MIHLIGLPHTPFDDVQASSCAFTAKAVRLAKMFQMIGRETTVYWGGSVTSVDIPFVSVLSDHEQYKYFGPYSNDNLPQISWDWNIPYWQTFNMRVIQHLKQNLRAGDTIALVGGAIHQQIVDAFPGYRCIEPGVGYEGICHNTFACFESYAWMHNRYGAYGIGDGRAFDAVIPNAIDPNDFDHAESHGYALFVGRLIQRKGPNVAGEIATRAGLPLKMAGAGVAHSEPGKIIATDGTTILGDVEHVGSVTGEARKALYAHAEVMLVPTLYIGPWEGVHAEALASGVQVVAPDYGVFTETIEPQFRYRTLGGAVEAVNRARSVRSPVLRERTLKRYSLEQCASMYEEWLGRLDLLDGAGWYS